MWKGNKGGWAPQGGSLEVDANPIMQAKLIPQWYTSSELTNWVGDMFWPEARRCCGRFFGD